MSDTRSFDFNSQPGVMHVLASIRASAVAPAIKNELRDLVFQYSNGGGDPSTRLALEQKLATHQIAPVARPASARNGRVLPFGSARPAPTFKSPTIVPTVTASPVATLATPAPVVHAPQTIPAPTPVVATPVIPPVITPVAPVATTPIATQAPVVVPTPVAPTPQTIPTPTTVGPTPAPSTTTPLDRIREIKIAVNKRIGNPVHLVDIDNAVGREYMAALLEAMKQLGGGVAGGIESAMVRLEAAYQAVDTVVTNYERKNINVTASTPTPQTPTATMPTQVAAPVPNTFAVPTVMTPSVPPQTFNQVVPPTPIQVSTPPTIKVVEPNTPRSHTAPQTTLPPTTTTSPYDSVVGYEAVSNITPRPIAAPIPVSPSVAQERAPLTPNDLKSTLNASSEGSDPLMSAEVDAGLEQLLHDWSLFKKSGLFGTGGRGREHPLFKKLAPLQIPLLLTGRFEGATQEIKQSITDYMNGWRFEQGIIYEQNETFEHYLRRVIRKILDLQKRKTSS